MLSGTSRCRISPNSCSKSSSASFRVPGNLPAATSNSSRQASVVCGRQSTSASVAELVDAADLKSADRNDHRGSSPLARTSIQSPALYPMHFNALQRAGSVFRILRLGQGKVFPIESANAAPGCGFLSRLQWKGAGTFPQIRRQGVSDQQVPDEAFFIQVGICGGHLATLHHQKR